MQQPIYGELMAPGMVNDGLIHSTRHEAIVITREILAMTYATLCPEAFRPKAPTATLMDVASAEYVAEACPVVPQEVTSTPHHEEPPKLSPAIPSIYTADELESLIAREPSQSQCSCMSCDSLSEPLLRSASLTHPALMCLHDDGRPVPLLMKVESRFSLASGLSRYSADVMNRTRVKLCESFSSLLFGVWFVFAPIPVHSLAGSISISALTNKCCFWLPDYLSNKSRCSLMVMACFTYSNWAVITMFAYSTWLVVGASWNLMTEDGAIPKIAKVELLKIGSGTVRQEEGAMLPPLLALAFWMQFSCILIFFRAFTRMLIHMYARSRGLHINATARVEYVMDFLIWTGFMGICALRLGRVLKACDKDVLVANGISPIGAAFCKLSAALFVNALFADIGLRFMWSCISELLDGDFKQTQAFRLVALLPLIDSECECSVCLTDDEGERCQLPCKHIYHKECMLSWAKMKQATDGVACPLCRATFVSSGYDDMVRTASDASTASGGSAASLESV